MKPSFGFKLRVETHILISRRQSHSGPCSMRHPWLAPLLSQVSLLSRLSRRSPLAMNARALALLSLAGTHTQLHQFINTQSIPKNCIFDF